MKLRPDKAYTPEDAGRVDVPQDKDRLVGSSFIMGESIVCVASSGQSTGHGVLVCAA
jgi:hypothetical protein